jgi:hypothetical protein
MDELLMKLENRVIIFAEIDVKVAIIRDNAPQPRMNNVELGDQIFDAWVFQQLDCLHPAFALSRFSRAACNDNLASVMLANLIADRNDVLPGLV